MRRRLVLAIALVAAVAVALLAVPLGVVLQHDYRTEDLLRLQRDTVAATRAIDLGGGPRDAVELPPSRDALAVYDLAGRRVAGRGPATAPAVVRDVLRTGRPQDADDGDLLAAAPLLRGERLAGALLARRPASAAVHDAHDAWLVLGALSAAIVLAAALAALALGRRLARPLERLAELAHRLGHGDFAVRAPPASVPEIEAVGAALNATAARLDDLVQRERAFTADASHQLRTPLAALRIELESLQLQGASGPELDAALAQADRLEETIVTLLAVARDLPRATGTTDLGALLDDVERSWSGVLAADARPLRRRGSADGDGATAQASGPVVRQVVDVLVGNALVHGRGAITIGVRELGEWIAVDVGDEGAGLPAEPVDVFARRTTGGGRDDGAGGGHGHGIGLPLAQSLAHAEGGRLVVTRARPEPVVTLLLRRPSQ